MGKNHCIYSAIIDILTAQMTMTAEQFDALPEEEIRKWELQDGELIEVPSATPLHNPLMRLAVALESYVEPKRFGVVLPKTDLAVRKDSRLRPDFGFFSPGRGPRST